MKIVKNGCGGALIMIYSDYLHPLHPKVAPILDLLTNTTTAVGIVTAFPVNAAILKSFEYCDVDKNGLAIAWSRNGFAYIGSFNRLTLASWLNDAKETSDFEPAVGMDVFIGNVSSGNPVDFENALKDHRRKESKL